MAKVYTPGNYWGKLVEVGTDKTKGGTLMFKLRYEVTHQLNENNWDPLPNPSIGVVTLWLSDKAFIDTCAKLHMFGWNGDFDNPKFNEEIISQELVCTSRQTGGEVYSDFMLKDWYTPTASGDGFVKNYVDQNTINMLNAKAAQAKRNAAPPAGIPQRPQTPAPVAVPAAQAPAPAPVPPSHPTHDTDPDVPF